MVWRNLAEAVKGSLGMSNKRVGAILVLRATFIVPNIGLHGFYITPRPNYLRRNSPSKSILKKILQQLAVVVSTESVVLER